MADSILIVDDDPDFRDLLLKGAEKLNLSCICASNGKEVFEILDREPVRLVLLDLILPVLDGIQILERVRLTHSKRELPIIIVSGVDDPERIADAFDAGANDFVNKPVNLLVLVARIRNQLDDGTSVGAATRAFLHGSVDSAFLVDGKTYDISFLHAQLAIHPDLAAQGGSADNAEMLARIFERFAGATEKYGIEVWSRTADSCLLAGKNPDSALMSAIEIMTLMTVYNMASDNPPNWIKLSIGIACGPTLYRDDVSTIFSEALNTSVHLVKHAADHGGIRLHESIIRRLNPAAVGYCQQEDGAEGTSWLYGFP